MAISTIFIFIGILLVLVIVHEFGHFIVAKWVGMRVDEFAFGFPPRIFAKKYGETTYALNAIPLGGYVSILGENGESADELASSRPDAALGAEKVSKDPRAFSNRPWWAQILVLIAGVTMNMLLALFIFIVISYGHVEVSVDDPTYGSRVENTRILVTDAAPNSPAYKAGIIPGSTILSITANGDKATLRTATSVVEFIGNHTNDALKIVYRKPDGIQSTTTIATVYGIVPDKKVIGISVESVGLVKTSILEAISIGYNRTIDITVLTFDGLQDLSNSLFAGKSVIQSLSGPVGIAKIVGQTTEYGIVAVLTLVAVLSINLAIFNALPLPALDGGRVIVVLIETVLRRRIPFKYYSWINILSFFLLIVLLIVVTIKDLKM